MKRIIKYHKLNNSDVHVNLKYFPEKALFFDIETTGFSSARAKLYLIGTARLEESSLVTEQFFADAYTEEPELLQVFSNLLMHFNTLISFHGTGFDIPFLKGRHERLNVPWVYDNKNYVDLYQMASSYKHIFHLENYKQQTLEKFLGMKREDLYTGGELIQVYHEYLNNQNDELLQVLLKHNYEDILGMTRLLCLYSIESFFQGNFELMDCNCTSYRKMDGSTGKELMVNCRLSEPLPAAISCNNDYFYLHGAAAEVTFRIPLYEGTLKYFYSNYKDYYYLPDEDMAIHKSVAAYVDKDHRKKAKAATCYGKKTGIFLPQYQELLMPAFYRNYKDAVSYFELKENFADDKEIIKQYCMHILFILKSGK